MKAKQIKATSAMWYGYLGSIAAITAAVVLTFAFNNDSGIRGFALFGAVVIVMMLTLTYRLARKHLIEPLNQLGALMEEFSRGAVDFSRTIDATGMAEVDALGREFNTFV